MNNKTTAEVWLKILIAAIVFACTVPFFVIFLRSFLEQSGRISAKAWYEVFLGTQEYLMRFWGSLILCLCITWGQIIVSVLAGYGFAKRSFPGRKILYFFLMIIMILPLQVTLVPNYLIMEKIHLLNTRLSLFLPAVFFPLGTMIITESFRAVPDDVLDAAKLDGCGDIQILRCIMIPLNKGSVVCAGLLSFLDAWNMVEQPVAFLKDFEKFPISVALAYASSSNLAVQMVCCILVVLPPLFLFLYFNKELVDGIVIGEKK